MDIEANEFNDRSHHFYDAALHTMYYIQHALRPSIDKLTWYFKDNLPSLLFLFNMKIRNHLVFIRSTLTLFIVLY